jgi:hypothetical protein
MPQSEQAAGRWGVLGADSGAARRSGAAHICRRFAGSGGGVAQLIDPPQLRALSNTSQLPHASTHNPPAGGAHAIAPRRPRPLARRALSNTPTPTPHTPPQLHHPNNRLQLKVADFDVIRRLGEGSFSTVILARYRADRREYAVKMISKSLVLRNKVRPW